jgi:hypothetical protein
MYNSRIVEFQLIVWTPTIYKQDQTKLDKKC